MMSAKKSEPFSEAEVLSLLASSPTSQQILLASEAGRHVAELARLTKIRANLAAFKKRAIATQDATASRMLMHVYRELADMVLEVDGPTTKPVATRVVKVRCGGCDDLLTAGSCVSCGGEGYRTLPGGQ